MRTVDTSQSIMTCDRSCCGCCMRCGDMEASTHFHANVEVPVLHSDSWPLNAIAPVKLEARKGA
jgi:hypothetical protein